MGKLSASSWTGLVLLAAALAAPYLVYPEFAMAVLCFALFACAFNLLTGYTGLLSFGHAAFFGGAAYIAGHAMLAWGLPPALGILAGTAAATLMGLVMGSLAIRRQGIYFAMITLAFAQLVYFLAVELPFTGGEDGLQNIPRGPFIWVFDVTDSHRLYYVVLAITLAGFLAIQRIIHSPFGQVLKAIRENEPRMVSLGYRTERYKLLAFVLSAGFAGLAGATKTLVFQLASLTDVQWQSSGEVVLMTLLGGIGTVYGPLVGAVIIVTLENYLASAGSWVTIIEGAVFVVCVLLFRRGIVGEIAHRLGRAR
ncbi:MAG TPA: branched-chain amino acid ABC transporter permease [Stellaceae bacterium]|nr:branched-chain amino acid ABC transporter permease [Stellaceae bacterium]